MSQKLLNYLSQAGGRSSNRWIVDLLKPKAGRESENAVRLAAMAKQEGIVQPAFSGAEAQAAKAGEVLAPAKTEAERLTQQAVQGGGTVEAAPVFGASLEQIPPKLPGGMMPPPRPTR